MDKDDIFKHFTPPPEEDIDVDKPSRKNEWPPKQDQPILATITAGILMGVFLLIVLAMLVKLLIWIIGL